MNDQTKYAFCIEMAKLAERHNDLERMNHWYARGWYFLMKTEDPNNPILKDFPMIQDKRGE